MTDKKSRLYVIGDGDFGVVFITLYPLRAAVVSPEEVDKYMIATGKTKREALGAIAASSLGFIAAHDDRDYPHSVKEVEIGTANLIASGASVSDADFCFIANLMDRWEFTGRNPSPPNQDALIYLQRGHDSFDADQGEYPAVLSDKGQAGPSERDESAARWRERPLRKFGRPIRDPDETEG